MSEIGALSAVNFVFYGLMISTVLLYMSYSVKNKPFSYNYYGKCQGLPAGLAGPGSAPMTKLYVVGLLFISLIPKVHINYFNALPQF